MSDDRQLGAGERRPASGQPIAVPPERAPGHGGHSPLIAGRSPAVELAIGELVLHGFAPVDRHRIGAAVERELARLLGEPALASRLGHPAELARLDGGAIELAAGASAEMIGAQIAQAIYRCCTGKAKQ